LSRPRRFSGAGSSIADGVRRLGEVQNEGGIVTEIAVVDGKNDAPLLVPAVEGTVVSLGGRPTRGG